MPLSYTVGLVFPDLDFCDHLASEGCRSGYAVHAAQFMKSDILPQFHILHARGLAMTWW